MTTGLYVQVDPLGLSSAVSAAAAPAAPAPATPTSPTVFEGTQYDGTNHNEAHAKGWGFTIYQPELSEGVLQNDVAESPQPE